MSRTEDTAVPLLSTDAGEPTVGKAYADKEGDRNRPRVLLSRVTPNQNARNALRSLVEHGMLAEFWTTLAWDPESIWNSLLPAALRTQLRRRSLSEAPAEAIRSIPWRELVRLGARSTPLEDLLSSGERPFSIIGTSRRLDARVARRIKRLRPDMVYAFEGAALRSFREAKKYGIATIDEQSSSHWRWTRDLMAEEAQRKPEFANILPALKDPASHLHWKDEELHLADHVCVPSEHVRHTLAGIVPNEKIVVVPYGAPEITPRRQINRDPRAPLKVLFVGNLGQHKGIGYLLEAMQLLAGMAELTIVGRRLHPNAKVDEACRLWRWFENLPHHEVMEWMQESDVLVLPSLSDAFGLVVTEALASGLPVIVTPNTGASEIIQDGREGYLVPICRADTIAARLETLHADRALLAEMSRVAQQTAAQNSWEHYRANWAQMIRSLAWRSR